MALDNGYHFAAQTLPTPKDTMYDGPSMDITKQSSTRVSLSLSSDSSPSPFPPSEDSRFLKQQGITSDGNVDEISAHESRRLTPNDLGVSLVAQIHSLRKELGNKDSIIGNMEETLYKSRAEKEQSTKELNSQRAEVTSLKKQMQSLEKDMLQALENVAKERDDALETIADTRKRLGDSTRKLHAQEEDANKARILWEKDRQAWDDKSRKMGRRVHIVEERLKTMVAETLIMQSTDHTSGNIGDHLDKSTKDARSSNDNDISGVSAMSHVRDGSLEESKGNSDFRSSRMSGLHDLGGSQMSGLSLAEELDFGEDENVVQEEDNDPNALLEDTYPSATQYAIDEKARNVMNFLADDNEEPHGDETSGQHSMGIINDYIDSPRKQFRIHYTDTGTQFSPLPSPSVQQHEPGILEKPVEQTERTANQSRKRITIPQIFVGQTLAVKDAQSKTLSMMSTGSQTVGHPNDPASRAKAANETGVAVPFDAKRMTSASTQTVEDPITVSKTASSRLSSLSMDVPVIAIHPPATRPSPSRNSVMLPPRTKNAACQVALELPRNTKSTSMQTEETRVTKRPVRIPPRLPLSNMPTQSPPRLIKKRQAGITSDPESLKRSLRSQAPTGVEERQPNTRIARIKNAYTENNDNGPLNYKQPSAPNRPIRSGSILAGFDASIDDDPENSQDHFSDDEFLNAAPIRKTLSKVQNSWQLVPHLEDSVLERLESAPEEVEDEKRMSISKPTTAKAKAPSQTTSKTFHTRPAELRRTVPSNARQPDIRRKALVSSGIVEHRRRSRSPSAPNDFGNEATIPPPFPVPTRFSSRKVPLSASDGNGSPSPHTTAFFSARHGQHHGTSRNNRKILRKVQSAVAVTPPPVPLRPESTQSLSATSTVPPSPDSPAPRHNQFTFPYGGIAELTNKSARLQSHAGETSLETAREQTSVVDAIAQTMVGEWMWKYIRKRTSFGITENPQVEFESGRNGDNGKGSGIRHKRWVWLAPYERAVMWSSKQPTSGPALLGKGGRKLAIQSVLDVKDDTPLPKNADVQAIFDRSILILTPQRALKFTAITRERHYIWLAALSYLSHSTRGMEDLVSSPPLPEQGYSSLLSYEPTTGRRTPIQTSIRTTRIKARPPIGVHSYSSPIGLIEREIIEKAKLPWKNEGAESDDAAEPPQIPRVAAHVRKRSSTGPRSVPLGAFHNYPNNAMAVASSCSLQVPTSREKYDRTLSHDMTGSSISLSPIVPDNFFDSGGTVRMEAFIDAKEKDYVVTGRSKSHGAQQGRKKEMSFWGFNASATRIGVGGAKAKGEDPFTGF